MHKTSAKTNEPFDKLAQAFIQLDGHLRPLRDGIYGGITALRSRLDLLPVAALAADNDGRYVAVNTAAADLTGYGMRELEAKTVWELTPGADADTGAQLWTAFIATGEQRGTYRLVTRRSTVKVVYCSRAHVLPNVHVSLLLRA